MFATEHLIKTVFKKIMVIFISKTMTIDLLEVREIERVSVAFKWSTGAWWRFAKYCDSH